MLLRKIGKRRCRRGSGALSIMPEKNLKLLKKHDVLLQEKIVPVKINIYTACAEKAGSGAARCAAGREPAPKRG